MQITLKSEIKDLSLPTSLENTLIRNQITTVEELTDLCSCEVMEIRNVGWKAYEIITDALHKNNLSLNAKCAIRQRMSETKNE